MNGPSISTDMRFASSSPSKIVPSSKNEHIQLQRTAYHQNTTYLSSQPPSPSTACRTGRERQDVSGLCPVGVRHPRSAGSLPPHRRALCHHTGGRQHAQCARLQLRACCLQRPDFVCEWKRWGRVDGEIGDFGVSWLPLSTALLVVVDCFGNSF